jgi:hypothetical protein
MAGASLAPSSVITIDMDRVRADCAREGIRVVGPQTVAPRPAPHIEQPSEYRADFNEHGCRDPSCWISSTGETGIGPLPRRLRRAAYDGPTFDWSKVIP